MFSGSFFPDIRLETVVVKFFSDLCACVRDRALVCAMIWDKNIYLARIGVEFVVDR